MMHAREHVTPDAAGTGAYDVAAVRRDFPILGERVHERPLVYLDNAATTQKPRAVIDAVSRYYGHDNANVHRAVHVLSERATVAYEGARRTVQRFVNAASEKEIVFVRGATEGVNLVAQTFGRVNVGEGDEVLISGMEHHSNIVPWQMLCAERGANLRVIPVDECGELDVGRLDALLSPRTKLVALVHVSNALGTINPARELCAQVHARGIPVLLDGAQAAPHLPIDVQDLGCDFYVFSGHKVYGPTGIGVLWAKHEHLLRMPPWQGGGDMILSVSFDKTIYNKPPQKFEAGTPNIAGAIGLAAAIDYVSELGLVHIAAHEHALLGYATERLLDVSGLRIIGTARHKAAVLSFVMDGAHPHDIGTIVDQEGIAIRSGHHCAQPLLERFGVPATARASFGLYNTRDEVDALAAALQRVRKVLG